MVRPPPIYFFYSLIFDIDVEWLRNVFESFLGSWYIGEKGSSFKVSLDILIVSPMLATDVLILISGRVLLNSSKSYFLRGDLIVACLGVSACPSNPSRAIRREIWSSSCLKDLSVRLFVSRNCETSSPIIDCIRVLMAGMLSDSGKLL